MTHIQVRGGIDTPAPGFSAHIQNRDGQFEAARYATEVCQSDSQTETSRLKRHHLQRSYVLPSNKKK